MIEDLEFQEFYRAIRTEISDDTIETLTESYRIDRFTEYFTSQLADFGVISDASVLSFNKPLGQARAISNAWAMDAGEGRLSIFVTLFNDSEEPESIAKQDLEKAVKQAIRVYEFARKASLESLEPSSDEYSMIRTIKDGIGQMLPTAAVAPTYAPSSLNMDGYISRLTENGGVDSYLSSLSDAEIAFLARRQAFRQGDFPGAAPSFPGDPSRASFLNPSLLGLSGMEGLPNPGLNGDSLAAASRTSAAVAGPAASDAPGGDSKVAAMPNSSRPSGAAASNPQAGSHAQWNNPHGPRPTAGSANLNDHGAAPNEARLPQAQGNPAMEQFLNQASDNELAQLIAMQDAAKERRRQQMPPF